MATLAAVAAHAKVGIGTVSRVLNDSPNVSPEMRERVLRSMQEVGYSPTRRRRSNAPRRARLIGVLVTYFDEPSAYQRLRGIVSRLQPHGYEVVLFNVAAPNQVQERLLEVPQHALDGLIVISVPLDPRDGERLATASFPTVLVDTASPGLPSVCIDDELGGRIATRHLVDLGHRRIGFVGEPPVNPFGFVASARREDGYRQVLAEAGIAVDPQLVRHGAHLRSTAKQLTFELLALPDPPTAIVATSDVQAVGVLEALDSLGLRAPGDVSVVGYDDIELASLMNLTTVRQPLEASGRRGADLVLEAIASGERSQLAEQLQIELVVRATTGPRR
ncbi:MAG: LacI family DNA-binding transcriptional regulator [Acidimicrobiales bacterium]